MNRSNIFFSLILVGVSFCIFTNSVLAQDEFYYSRGRKIPLTISAEKISIKFKTEATEDKIQNLIATEPALGVYKPLRGASAGFYSVQLNSTADVRQIVNRMKNKPEVEVVNPVYVLEESVEVIPYDVFIIQFASSVTREQIDKLNAQHHVEVIGVAPASQNLYALRVTAKSDLTLLKMSQLYYESLPAEWSLPDFITPIELHDLPNDTFFQNQYYLYNIGQTGGVLDADIDALEAWDISKGSSSVIISVIDEGTGPHEDLTLWTNTDEFVGDANGDGRPGVINIDDDGDGLIDEDSQGRQPGEQGV